MQTKWVAWVVAGLIGAATLKGEARNSSGLPSFPGVVEVRSVLPGRIRLGLPSLSQRMDTALQMKSQLESTGVFHRVELNSRTGSVLLEYDTLQVEPAVLEGAVIKLMGLEEEIDHRPLCKVEAGIRSLVCAVDSAVYTYTDGLLDARTLAGGALCVLAIRSIRQSGWAVPGAMTLLWWASSLWRRGSHE